MLLQPAIESCVWNIAPIPTKPIGETDWKYSVSTMDNFTVYPDPGNRLFSCCFLMQIRNPKYRVELFTAELRSVGMHSAGTVISMLDKFRISARYKRTS
jgi:hypothetical protein